MGAKRRYTTYLTATLVYCAPILAVAALATPFFWMIATSLKSSVEIAQYPPSLWPKTLHWENFRDAWQAAPFGRFYFNSVVTGVATTALQIVFALMMAYAFVFIKVPGKAVLFLGVLATMMIPDEMKLIPNFILLDKLHWIDTYWALIIPPAAHAFPVFVLHEQFRIIPKALVESAKVDGASHARVLVSILLPLSRPVVASVLLISFWGRWNDYLWPLVITNRETMRTLPVGLAYLQASQESSPQWGMLMAGAVFVIIPALVLFVLVQRQFVEGITRGALKG